MSERKERQAWLAAYATPERLADEQAADESERAVDELRADNAKRELDFFSACQALIAATRAAMDFRAAGNETDAREAICRAKEHVAAAVRACE